MKTNIVLPLLGLWVVWASPAFGADGIEVASTFLNADVLDSSLKVRFGFDAPPEGNLIVDSSPGASHSGTNVGATWLVE